MEQSNKKEPSQPRGLFFVLYKHPIIYNSSMQIGQERIVYHSDKHRNMLHKHSPI